MRNGFSLVELSIVLVILGLLTGGILAGQNLIRAAELRAVTTEFDRYIAATQTFRDKYFAIPGDFRDATKFWGRLSSAGHCVTNSAQAVATPGACDGGGNGQVNNGSTANQSQEPFQYWRQLALAGLIEGDYTGIAGAAGTRQLIRGENAPASKLGQGAWHLHSVGSHDGSSFAWAGDYGNSFTYGKVEATDITEAPIMSPEEMWNLDTKMDDGRPSFGRLTTYRTTPNCQTQTNQPQSAAVNNEYNLTNTSNVCYLIFKSGL